MADDKPAEVPDGDRKMQEAPTAKGIGEPSAADSD